MSLLETVKIIKNQPNRGVSGVRKLRPSACRSFTVVYANLVVIVAIIIIITFLIIIAIISIIVIIVGKR